MSELPVSVVIPHIDSRAGFLKERCLPSVMLDHPAQVFVEAGPENACLKRNRGAQRATEPYLLFVDDDTVLKPGSIPKMVLALKENKEASFVYSDTERVLYPGVPYPYAAGRRNAMTWDPHLLKSGNYVDTTSLLRRFAFIGFDPEMRRFQDWDMWLRMSAAGHIGAYIPEVLFEQHHFDIGISASIPFEEALVAIKRKHKLS